MAAEENKALVRRLVDAFGEAWRTGNMDVIDPFFAADRFVNHTPGMPPDLEGYKQTMPLYRTAFPDLTLTAEDIIAEGDKAVLRLVSRGTHQGELMGIQPTGKPITVSEIHIYRIGGGKIVERWGVFDALGLLQQIGAVPAPEQAPASADD